jgi:hypothetical protein
MVDVLRKMGLRRWWMFCGRDPKMVDIQMKMGVLTYSMFRVNGDLRIEDVLRKMGS